MRVLFITSVYPSDKKPGAGVFHHTQADSLQALGINVDVICPVPKTPKVLGLVNSKYKDYIEQPQKYEWNGVQVYRPRFIAVPGQLKWAQPHKRFAAAIDRAIKENNLSFDVIHAHLAMPSGGAAAILSEKYDKPYVLTLHGSDVNVYPEYSKSAMEAFKYAVKNASEVIAVSGALAEQTKKLTGVSPRVLSIGIDMEKFQGMDIHEKEKKSVRSKLNLPIDKILLLYVGRLVNDKGIRELTEAINELDDNFRLVLVGDGPLAEELKFNKKVILTGQIPNEQVRDYLHASDIFVLPSYNEGMPTVIIEALALKVPVLSSNVGGIPELFGEHQHLLIEPKSSKEIVNRTKEYVDGSVYSPTVQHSLFKKVKEAFNVSKNSQELIKLYTNLRK